MNCSVCGAENDDRAVVCSSCRSYLQSKVDALDLFDTLWRLLESPGHAFKRIALSQHKNYVLLLSALLGCCLAYGVVWFKSFGGHFANILELIGAGLLAGPPLGVLSVALLSVMLGFVARLAGKKATFRNLFAVVSYAGAPMVLSLIIVFPLEVALFGLDFFRQNPSPMVLKPFVYIILLLFDGMAIVWSWILLVRGISAASGMASLTSFLVACALLIVSVGAVLGFGLL
jgi:hypothetical protein